MFTNISSVYHPLHVLRGDMVLLSHQGQFSYDPCVELPHVKHMAAVMCLLVWELLYLTPQLSSMVVSLTYPQHVWVSSYPEVCHYCLVSSFSCQIQGSHLMETKHKYNKATQP